MAQAQPQARHEAPEFDKQQLQQTTVTGMELNAEQQAYKRSTTNTKNTKNKQNN